MSDACLLQRWTVYVCIGTDCGSGGGGGGDEQLAPLIHAKCDLVFLLFFCLCRVELSGKHFVPSLELVDLILLVMLYDSVVWSSI